MVSFWENSCIGGSSGGWCGGGAQQEPAEMTKNPAADEKTVQSNDASTKKQSNEARNRKSLLDDTMDETIMTAPTAVADIEMVASGVSVRSKKSIHTFLSLCENIELTASKVDVKTAQEEEPEDDDVREEVVEETKTPETGSVSSKKSSQQTSEERMEAEQESETTDSGEEPASEVNETPDQHEDQKEPISAEQQEPDVPMFSKSVSFDRSVKSAQSAETRWSDIISLQSSASSGMGRMKELLAYRKKVELGLQSPRSDAESSAGSMDS